MLAAFIFKSVCIGKVSRMSEPFEILTFVIGPFELLTFDSHFEILTLKLGIFFYFDINFEIFTFAFLKF